MKLLNLNYYCRALMATILVLLYVWLTGCATLAATASKTISKKMQEDSAGAGYPAAQAVNTSLDSNPPSVDLSQYQSVQSPIGRPHQRPDLAIAVAASGGGYRAANLTAGVLMGLEKITDPHLKGNLLEEVDYFSTVSGGGFGVGYYLASLYNFMQLHGGGGPFTPEFSFTNTINNLPDDNALDKDYSGELFFGGDRAELFEQNLANTILRTDHGTLRLGDIFVPSNASPSAVTMPYWVTNSTIYQNAALFPFTPDVLAKYAVTSYAYDQKMNMIQGDYADIPFAVGMTASASFPFALTAITLGSNGCTSNSCYLQLLDGGLADNLGVDSAISLLKQDPSKIKILIIIDAYSGPEQPYSLNALPPSGTTLLWRVLSMSTDASRQRIKPKIGVLAKDILCSDGKTSNVLTIYLDLENYARARQISTGLFITRKQQKLLLQVGQDLVADNPQFTALLKPLLDGNMQIGHCQMSDTARK